MNINKGCIVSMTADPITLGHRDIIKRASKIFSKVYVLIPESSSKRDSVLNFDERVDVIKHDLYIDDVNNYEIHKINGTLADTAKRLGVNVIVRGIRNGQDLTYEMDMNTINQMINGYIETVMLPCKPHYAAVSSSAVRELCRLNKCNIAKQFASDYAIGKIRHKLGIKPFILGVTGGIACGKSYLTKALEMNGWCIISADKIYHNVVLNDKQYTEDVRVEFNKALNRLESQRILNNMDILDISAKTDKMPFDIKSLMMIDGDFRAAVNKIAWKAIDKIIRDLIDKYTNLDYEKIAVECPLLFEKGTEIFNDIFDATVCVYSNRSTQKSRLIHNRSKTHEEAERYLEIQRPVEEKIGLCDYSIKNDSSKDEFDEKINQFIHDLDLTKRKNS